MRRPVDVNAHFRFLLFVSLFRFSQAASVAILPSALFCERYSLGASWVFSFQWCCYLIIDLCSHRFCGSWAPGLSRSHLDSAVELGCPDRNSLGHFPHRFLTIAQWFVHLSAYPQPMQQYRQLSSYCHDGSLLGIFSSSLRNVRAAFFPVFSETLLILDLPCQHVFVQSRTDFVRQEPRHVEGAQFHQWSHRKTF